LRSQLMSTQTERPETAPAMNHQLDQLSGVVPSPVRPASPRLAWVALAGGVLAGLALWLVIELPVAVAAVLGYLIYLVAVHVTYRIVGGARVATDQTMRALVYG